MTYDQRANQIIVAYIYGGLTRERDAKLYKRDGLEHVDQGKIL